MNRTPILIAAAIAMFFVSCKNSSTGLPVPKDAAVVVHINASSLSSKLSWKEIQATEWFKEAYKDADDSLQKKLLDDPKNSGIDINSSFDFFVKKQGHGGIVVFEGNLKDAVAFEAMVKKMNHNHEVAKNDDFAYLKDNGTNLISWTNSKFIFMSDAPFGKTSMNSFDNNEASGFHQDSLLVFTKDLLHLSSGNSIESDKRFTSLIKENGDVHFWVNMEQYMSAVQEMMDNKMFMMSQGLSGLFEGSVSTGTLNFDDGKISVTSKRYLSDKMKTVMDKYQFKNVTSDEVNRIPSSDVDLALVANYPPEASKELFKTLGYDGFINGFLGRYNTNLDELVQAMKGNIVLSVSDFSMSATETTIPGTNQTIRVPEPKVKFLLGLSVNNKATFDKLIGIAQQQIKDPEVLTKINFKTTNDWFALSNNSETVDQFLAGGNNKLLFTDKITGHPFGMYIDLQKLIKAVRSNTFMFGVDVDTTATSMWQDVVATGGDYKDGVVTSQVAVNLVDKNTNSLKQLNHLMETMYESQKKRREAWKTYNDSTATTLPQEPDTTAKPQ